jgi:hypothetical protein
MLDRPGAMPKEEQIRLYPSLDPKIDKWTKRFTEHVIDLAERRGAAVASV